MAIPAKKMESKLKALMAERASKTRGKVKAPREGEGIGPDEAIFGGLSFTDEDLEKAAVAVFADGDEMVFGSLGSGSKDEKKQKKQRQHDSGVLCKKAVNS